MDLAWGLRYCQQRFRIDPAGLSEQIPTSTCLENFMRSITRAILTAATLSVALVTVPSSAQANLLVNGSFEDFASTNPPLYSDRNIDSTPGWTQILAGVDLMHNLQTYSVIDASDGLQFLDLNKSVVRSNGGIYQTVAATSGTTYSLTLDSVAWYPTSRGGSLRYELYDPVSATFLL